MANPAPSKPNALTCYTDDSKGETITITVGEKNRAPTTRSHHIEPQHYETTATHDSDFKVARRKNIMSYFIGNIDIDYIKEDIYEYMKASKVTPTFINVFYGRNAAAAKVNREVAKST